MACYTWSVCNFKQHKSGWRLDWSVGGKSSSPSTHEGLLRVVPATFPGRQEHLTVWDLSSMRFLLQHRWAAMTSHVPPSAERNGDRQTDKQTEIGFKKKSPILIGSKAYNTSVPFGASGIVRESQAAVGKWLAAGVIKIRCVQFHYPSNFTTNNPSDGFHKWTFLHWQCNCPPEVDIEPCKSSIVRLR